MVNQTYTNKELARDYFRVAVSRPDVLFIAGYLTQKKRIENLSVDLAAYYREHRSLAGLEGISKRTKNLLELILSKGVEEAEEIVSKEVEEEMQRRELKAVPRKAVRTSN